MLSFVRVSAEGLCVAALLAILGMAACQSVRNVSSVNADTRLGETTELLRQGVRDASLRAARSTVEAWEARLRSEEAEPLDAVADTLDALEAQLRARPVEAAATGRLLRSLSEQTRATARREGAPADRLNRLADGLAQAGDGLR